MWAIYWRSISVIVLLIMLVALLHQHFAILDLANTIAYYPTIFWGIIAAVLAGTTILQSKGLIFLLWGKRLAYSNSIWRLINISTILFFCFLSVLAIIVNTAVSDDLWAMYKLYLQPIMLLVWPLILGIYLRDRICV